MFVLLPLGYDVIAQAQSGTGKTATFAISILQQLDIEQKETQALVLAPTRELAQQVCCSWGHDNLSVSDLNSTLDTDSSTKVPFFFFFFKSTKILKLWNTKYPLRIGVVSVHGCIGLKGDLASLICALNVDNWVIWWHTIFRDWLLKWRYPFISLITLNSYSTLLVLKCNFHHIVLNQCCVFLPASSLDPEGHSGSGWLHGGSLPCLHRRDQSP